MSDNSAPGNQALAEGLRAHLAALSGEPVVMCETHISWVLLAGDRAYKLKKAVRLPFLDFSTLSRRRHYCEQELRLNRRLAPELYLEVLAVCGTPDQPRLARPGETTMPIDHVLCMRRFPAGALLSERLAAGLLDAQTLQPLAARLADFHAHAERATPASPSFRHAGTPAQVMGVLQDVIARLRTAGGDGGLAPVLHWLAEQSPALEAAVALRRAQGAVRECHGDLHLANTVAIGGNTTGFDCIEFDPALRWTDTAADIGFLTMDLKAHGRDDLAWSFLDDYLACSGDHAMLATLRFYEVQRALVRALVAALSGPAARAADAPDYLACAARLCSTMSGQARLLITHGASGSGKSWLSRRLVPAAGAVRLRSDIERKRLFGLAATDSSAALGPQVYAAAATERTFDSLALRARQALKAGYPVIIDATFLQRAQRRRFAALARELAVPFGILDCRAGEAVMRERVARRQGDASEATLPVLMRQLAEAEALDEVERAAAIIVDTSGAVDPARLAARWLSAGTDHGDAHVDADATADADTRRAA